MTEDLSIMVAGAAGQGMQTIGAALGKIFVRGGCEVFANQDNMSRIRGGHNFFQIRICREPVKAPSMPLHVLIALNEESIALHREDVVPEGVILFDEGESQVAEKDERFLGMPMKRLAEEIGGDSLFSNSVALGATIALVGWDFERLEKYLRELFAEKADTVEGNVKAARAGFEKASDQVQRYKGPKIQPQRSESKMFLTGHEAVAMGALVAGCQFMSAYPMSPSTSIMQNLAARADAFHMVVEQAEDEIAAINMAIGASYAGLRAMTATSGGGFSLMVEAFGLAGISETPLVVIEAQRPGPATGLPTRTAQSDLLFVLHSSQDEFPRVILSPGTAREAFYQTIEAFHLADKYQIPVVVLTDQCLAESYFTETRFDISDLSINRYLMDPKEAEGMEAYKRYAITDSGVSPRTIPGAVAFEVVADSHEHDVDGHMTEDAQKRKKMVEKRFRKIPGLNHDVSGPTKMGDPRADALLMGWGSTYGAMAEALEILLKEGIPVKGLHFSQLCPFPLKQVADQLQGVKRWGVVEANYTGQLSRLIQMELQGRPDGKVLKYTGRPFLPEEIAKSFRKEVLSR